MQATVEATAAEATVQATAVTETTTVEKSIVLSFVFEKTDSNASLVYLRQKSCVKLLS